MVFSAQFSTARHLYSREPGELFEVTRMWNVTGSDRLNVPQRHPQLVSKARLPYSVISYTVFGRQSQVLGGALLVVPYVRCRSVCQPRDSARLRVGSGLVHFGSYT
jgi:hypothetical protein